jgi:hypothetical protein
MIGVRAPEPNFQNEKELQNAIAFAIRGAFDNTRTVVITGFGLDVAIFTENTDPSASFWNSARSRPRRASTAADQLEFPACQHMLTVQTDRECRNLV